jgi:hypothetical protein
MPSKPCATPPTEPGVSDHAVVRYMERVLGLDVDAIRREILTPERAQAIKFGAHVIKAEGYVLRVEKNVVVTVLTR